MKIIINKNKHIIQITVRAVTINRITHLECSTIDKPFFLFSDFEATSQANTRIKSYASASSKDTFAEVFVSDVSMSTYYE